MNEKDIVVEKCNSLDGLYGLGNRFNTITMNNLFILLKETFGVAENIATNIMDKTKDMILADKVHTDILAPICIETYDHNNQYSYAIFDLKNRLVNTDNGKSGYMDINHKYIGMVNVVFNESNDTAEISTKYNIKEGKILDNKFPLIHLLYYFKENKKKPNKLENVSKHLEDYEDTEKEIFADNSKCRIVIYVIRMETTIDNFPTTVDELTKETFFKYTRRKLFGMLKKFTFSYRKSYAYRLVVINNFSDVLDHYDDEIENDDSFSNIDNNFKDMIKTPVITNEQIELKTELNNIIKTGKGEINIKIEGINND